MVKLGQHEGAGMAHRRHLTPSLFHDSRRRNVGLIGGSFNPAHDGHLHMAMLARKILGLDEIWWMVTPQNPLKPSEDMSLLQNRLAYARKLVGKRTYIRVIAPELGARNNYTFNTLNLLHKVAPRVNFVWIMGADNLAQFSEWKDWDKIATMVTIAVFNRPGYSQKALSSKMARRYSGRRISEYKCALAAKLKPPRWVFLHTLLNPIFSELILVMSASLC